MQHLDLAGVALVEAVEAELAVVGAALLELALEVADGEVGEVVGALVGAGEVRRERGVAVQPGQRHPPRREREHRALGVVQHLRPLAGRRARPTSAAWSSGSSCVGRRPRPRCRRSWRSASAGDVTACRRPSGRRRARRPARSRRRARASQPPSSPPARTVIATSKPESSISSSDVSVSNSRSRSTRNSRPSKSVCTSCRSHGRSARSAGAELEVEVADQRVELPVADHVAEVLAQRLALLAGDLVGVGDDVVEPVVLVDPLGGEAPPDPGDAGQVVGGLPHQRRELGVARRRHAVLVLDRRRSHPGQVGDAAHRVEHRGPVGDQLDGVAVAGEDQDLHVRVLERLGDERGDDVVGLVAVLLQERDVAARRAPPRSAAAGC